MQTELAHPRDPLPVHIEQIDRRAADSIGAVGQHHAYTQLGGTGCLQGHVRPRERKQHLGQPLGCLACRSRNASGRQEMEGCIQQGGVNAVVAGRCGDLIGKHGPAVQAAFVSPRLGEPSERSAIAEPLRRQLRIELRDVDRHCACRRPLIKHGRAASGIGAPLVRDQRARGVTGPRRFIASSAISAVQRKGASPRVVRGSHRDLQAGRTLRRQCQRHRERQFTDRMTADRLPGSQRQFQQ